jgi:hypothetical protein
MIKYNKRIIMFLVTLVMETGKGSKFLSVYLEIESSFVNNFSSPIGLTCRPNFFLQKIIELINYFLKRKTLTEYS